MHHEGGRAHEPHNLSNLTQNLMEMLLQGDGLTAIVSAVSGILQTDVGMIDADGAVQARSGAGNTPDALAQIAAHLDCLGAWRMPIQREGPLGVRGRRPSLVSTACGSPGRPSGLS